MALAFVTGASRGLGYEVAKALKARGDEVIGISRDRQRAEAASSELGIAFELMDCQQIAQVRSVSGELLSKYGTPEILVLAHGVMSEKMAKTLKTNDQEWARVLDINLNSVFTLVNSLAAPMAEARNGRVIIFSACLGRMSGPGNAGGLAPYRISKAGVNALVRILLMKQIMALEDFWLMQYVPTIVEQIWVELMRQEALPREQRLQSG